MFKSFKTKDIAVNYLFVMPALFLFLTFYIYPFIKVFQLSAFDWDGILPAMKFVGLRNFKEIFTYDTAWWLSMRNAMYITILALVFQNALALTLALACDRDIKGAQFYRVVFYLPPVLSGIVVGLIWDWIYNGNYGLLNYWFTQAGFGHLARSWLSDPKTALTCVAVIHMWKGFGWGFVILLAGLQGIPRELYEAAKVDGASSWDIFRRITVPLMLPIFILVAILTILGTMQIYDIIVSTTGGGPGFHTEVPITRILQSMRGSSQLGYACAQGIVFGIILLIASILQMQVSKTLKQE